MASEEAPFLPPEKDSSNPDNAYLQLRPPQRRWYRPWASQVFAHLGIVAIYTVVSIFAIRSQRCITFPPAAIDNVHITYNPTLFHRLNATPYAGPPSPEVDAAWDALLAPMHITVSEQELKRDNQASIPLPESGGYLGWMGVFHELHCIRILRRAYYSHQNVSSSEEQEQKRLGQHVDHCLEWLRQAAVCHADASLTTFKWHPEKTRPMFNASESIHVCVDWQVLMESVKSRVVDEAEILRLRNPLMAV